MKIRLVILLLVCVHCNMCDMKALGDDESAKNSYLQTFNSIRQDWANKYQIANMHEMSYDYDLEKIARKLTCSTMMRPGPNYMPAAFPDEQSLKLILTVDLKKQEEAVMNLFGGMGHPENSGMACVMFDPPCSGTGGQVPIACIAGPKTSLSSWDFKKGPPGSQCPNGKTNGGLCVGNKFGGKASIESHSKANFQQDTQFSGNLGSQIQDQKNENNSNAASCLMFFFYVLVFVF